MIRFKRTPTKNHKARIVSETNYYGKCTYTDRRDDEFNVYVGRQFGGYKSGAGARINVNGISSIELTPNQLQTLRRVINKHFDS